MDNRFEYKKFKLEDENIYWKGNCYPLSSVKHLIYSRVLTVQKTNFVKVGQAHRSQLCIVLDNEHKIKLKINEATPFYGFNIEHPEGLGQIHDLYIYLAEKTFEKRISSYIQQIEEQGYFEYVGDKFYPHSKVVHRKTEFFLGSTHFYRKPGYLGLKLKHSSLTGWIKSILTEIEIPTDTDTDVLFTLLVRYMGLKWKD